MGSPPDTGPADHRRASAAKRWAAVELFAASGIAIALPVLDTFGRSPEVFVAAGARRAELVAFALVVLIGPPLALWLVVCACSAAGPRAGRGAHTGMIAVLAGFVVAQAATEIATNQSVVISAGLAGAALAAVLHWRVAPFRSWLRLLACAPVLFAAMFLTTAPTAQLLSPASASATASGASDTPVVLVIFDEWPLAALVDGEGHIDAELFPNLSRLAGDATWYRNTTTMTDWTQLAVPSILTGQAPRAKTTAPTPANHPQSIYTLLGDSHEVHATEHFPLCPDDVCGARTRPGALGALLGNAADLWWERLDTGDAEAPPASAIGFGGPDESIHQAARFTNWISEIRPSNDTASGRPPLDVAHVLLPHSPWLFVPSGHRYNAPDPTFGLVPEPWAAWGSDEAAALGRRRLVLQAMWVDHLVGQLIDQLEATGRYDESLLVLTADHGISFVKGAPARGVRSAASATPNEDQMLWVPLLVKAPDQRVGVVDDRNVVLVDILPTIADHLGIDVPWTIDGISAAGDRRRGDEKPFFFWQTIDDPDNPDRVLDVDGPARLAEVLSSRAAPPAQPGRPAWWRPFLGGDHDELLGRRAAELPQGAPMAGGAVLDDPLAWQDARDDDASPPRIAAYVSGRLTGTNDARPDVAVVVDGVVAAVVPTFDWLDHPAIFGAVVPEPLVGDGVAQLELFVVDGSGVLHPFAAP